MVALVRLPLPVVPRAALLLVVFGTKGALLLVLAVALPFGMLQMVRVDPPPTDERVVPVRAVRRCGGRRATAD